MGRPLVPARFCGEVRAGTAFVASPAPTSLDSRYFGAVPISTLTVVRSLWTF
jgi:type IV secretory pathway protease TraF